MKRDLALGSVWVVCVTAVSACGGYGAQPGAAEETTATSTGGEAQVAGEEATPLGPTAEDQAAIDGFDGDLGRLGTDLDGAMELSTPNCGRAGELRDAICDLADRICDISGRHPEDTDVSGKCETGRARCERARTDVEGVCG